MKADDFLNFLVGFAIAVAILSSVLLTGFAFGWLLVHWGPLPASALVIAIAAIWVGFAFAADEKKKREAAK